jgi:lysophospholipase L1-like esterase
MEKLYFRKTYLFIGLAIILIVIVAVYINRSYAHIYNTIDSVALTSPDKLRTYLIANNMAAKSTLTYVALGDSLSSGVGANKYEESFPYLLAQYLAGNDYQVTLRNHSAPGAKTADLLTGLLPGAIKDNPDIITLLIGTNDVHSNISQKDFSAGYEQILKRLSTETKAKIYIINLPFIGATDLILPPHNYLLDQRTKKFNAIIKNLAIKYQVKYIDLYTSTEALFKKPGSYYSADFFHPSAEGYKIWADLIYADLGQ